MVVKKTASKHRNKSHGVSRHRDGNNGHRKKKLSFSDRENAEIHALEARITAEAPKAGYGAFASEVGKSESEASTGGPTLTMQLFKDLPISQRTRKALDRSGFVKMTEIQRGAIPHALAGRDILGEAKTGSGKTLAFLVPLVELLFRARWTSMDGLGGLVVSPTRELSYQIFQVLNTIGAEHDLSAGCIVGGRDLSEEQKSVTTMNVLVATPGRLLQHLDESPGFDASNLQMLALDEADRILDFGFQETIHHILSHLPKERQSMLFSATLHNSVHRLGKVALKAPEMISVHKNSLSRTPEKLKQVFMTVALDQKIDVLFSFLRSHSQKKTIVFVSSCKQVRFFYECFRQLKPGPAVMELHGRQSLMKRMVVFKEFSEREKAVALFCTDIAARGVDFPVVDWVLQFDCPDTVDSYVHRVGRTARFESGGNSALFLLPSEETFVAKLKAQKIDVKSISAKQGKIQTIQQKIQAVLAGNASIKHLAQKAYVSYVRSVRLMKDREVFKPQELPLEEFALSLGLVAIPEGVSHLTEISDAEKNLLKSRKNQSALHRLKEKIKAKKHTVVTGKAENLPAAGDESESDETQKPAKKKLSRWERRQRRMERLEACPATSPVEADDDLLVPVASTVEAVEEASLPPQIRKRKLKLGRDGVAVGSKGEHVFFDGSGKSSSELAQVAEEHVGTRVAVAASTEESRKAFLKRVSRDLAERDVGDAATSRARIHEKHKKRRRLAKERQNGDGDDSELDNGVTLGGGDSSALARSPTPSNSDGEEDKTGFPEQKEAPPKGQSKKLLGRGKAVHAADDLDALERQALSRLGGLF